MDIPETNEWMLRHAANGLAGLKALRDLPTEDADAINYAYQQLLAAADTLARGSRHLMQESSVTTPDEARVFIRYEDRYEFIDAEGRIVAVMTPREFDMWKTRNPLNRTEP